MLNKWILGACGVVAFAAVGIGANAWLGGPAAQGNTMPTGVQASAEPSIADVQKVVERTLGPDYAVVGISQDGALSRLSINYHGYSINNIYLREDGTRLFRAEQVVPPSAAQRKAVESTAKARTAYRESIKDALASGAKTDSPVPDQAQAATASREPARIAPPALPRNTEAADIDALYQQLESRPFVRSSTGDRILYVFDDYRCPACRDADAYLKKVASERGIEVRHVPVAVLGPESLALAAYVLEPDSMAERASRGEAARGNPMEILKAIQNKSITVSEATLSEAMRNFKLLMNIGRGGGTPTFVYQTKHGARASTAGSEAALSAILDSIPAGQ